MRKKLGLFSNLVSWKLLWKFFPKLLETVDELLLVHFRWGMETGGQLCWIWGIYDLRDLFWLYTGFIVLVNMIINITVAWSMTTLNWINQILHENKHQIRTKLFSPISGKYSSDSTHGPICKLAHKTTREASHEI